MSTKKSIRNHDIRGGFLPSLGRKFGGKSARQMFEEVYGVYIPLAFTEDC